MENVVSEVLMHCRIMVDRFRLMANRFEVTADRNLADHSRLP